MNGVTASVEGSGSQLIVACNAQKRQVKIPKAGWHRVELGNIPLRAGYEADKTKLYSNVMNILSEVGIRYGDKLDGWWFDGSARYLNCHFDGSSAADGILTAPFKELTLAARKGNAKRMVAYNS